jgi:hypothetical protein
MVPYGARSVATLHGELAAEFLKTATGGNSECLGFRPHADHENAIHKVRGNHLLHGVQAAALSIEIDHENHVPQRVPAHFGNVRSGEIITNTRPASRWRQDVDRAWIVQLVEQESVGDIEVRLVLRQH